MPIATTCPACRHAYRLKDELAGKRVKCKNAACQETFTVPKPTPAPVPDADAVAAMAFAEEQPDPAADTRAIAMTCAACDQQWSEPFDKQGKNVLCPNPECRTRQKVPVAKATGPADWRAGRGGPSLAKLPELEGVNSSGDAGYVSGEALRRVGLGRPELEPRPAWQKVAVVVVPLALVAGAFFGVRLVLDSRSEAGEAALMAAALEALPDPAGDALPKSEVPPARAALLVSAGRYDARRAAGGELDAVEAAKLLARARQELVAATPSPGRDFLWGELVAAQLELGGDAASAGEGRNLRWLPQAAGVGRARVSEKVYSVQEELRQTFEAMRAAEPAVPQEARLAALRAAARALAASGAPDAAGQLVPSLFAEDGAPEADAHAAAERFRATGDAARLAEAVAAGVRSLTPQRPAGPTLLALGRLVPNPPPELAMPNLGDAPDDRARLAHGTLALLKKNPAEAIALAKRPGKLAARVTLLALAAEWSDDPGAAATAAAEVIAVGGDADAGVAPDGALVRLAAAAGRANLAPTAEALAKAAGRDDAKVLARAVGLAEHWKLTPATEPDSAWELPAKSDAIRLGHLWGRMALARANAAAGESRPAASYDGVARPFGLAGAALGRQDRTGK